MKIVCNGKPIKLELVEKGRAKKNNGSDIDGRGGRSFLSIFRRVFFFFPTVSSLLLLVVVGIDGGCAPSEIPPPDCFRVLFF